MKGSQVFRNPVVLYHDKKNNNYYIKKNLVSILKVGLKATIHEATMCIVACKNANMLPVIRTPVYSKQHVACKLRRIDMLLCVWWP